MKIANLYESPAREVAVGHIKAMWRDLAREAGSRTVGLRRIEIAEDHFSTPAHEHGADEEIFFVLDGEGLLWQKGETCAVGAGDCIVHRPKRGAHTLRGGVGGLDVLVFGQRRDASLTALPRAGVAWSFPRWVELGDGESPFAREAAAGAPECPAPNAERPPNVAVLVEVPAILDGRARRIGSAGGAVATGLNHVVLSAGQQGAPAHCHSLEEELFVVLDGGGVLELWGAASRVPKSIGCVPVTWCRARREQVSRTLFARAKRALHILLTVRESPTICASIRSRAECRSEVLASRCALRRSTTCLVSERRLPRVSPRASFRQDRHDR